MEESYINKTTAHTMNELRRPSFITSKEQHEIQALQKNTNSYVVFRNIRDSTEQSSSGYFLNKIASYKGKFIKFSFRKKNEKMIMSPLFYNNKTFITETKLDRSRVQSSFEIDRSGEEVITPRRDSK